MKRDEVKTAVPPSHEKPGVSVIMPVYNVALYVGRAIESILQQTFTDFEFIIIDDGSTDSTWEIVCSYQDDRIIRIQNETNQGNYPSRNRGMKLARGKYIAVMDGDDIAWPERLKKQFNHLETHPHLLAVGSDFEYTVESCQGGIPYQPYEVLVSLLKGYYILHPSLFIRTAVIRSLKGYNESYCYAADYDLTCRIALLGPLEVLPEVLMTYRKHSRQITSKNKEQQAEYALAICKKYQIAFINKYRSGSQQPVKDREVSYHLCGIIIGFYTYARYSGNKHVEQMADDMLEHLFKNDCFSRIEEVLGIGFGLLYLLRNGFVEGEEDEVLEEIDERIMVAIEKEIDLKKKENLIRYVTYRRQPEKEKLCLQTNINFITNLKQ